MLFPTLVSSWRVSMSLTGHIKLDSPLYSIHMYSIPDTVYTYVCWNMNNVGTQSEGEGIQHNSVTIRIHHILNTYCESFSSSESKTE